MVIDKESSILRMGAKLWLNNKEIILQVGGIIQKGSDLCLDGFFGIELFPKNSNIEKFSIEGKIVDLKTDEKILKWSIDYSRIGSTRRELDDPCYIFLNCINTMLDLKEWGNYRNDERSEIASFKKRVN
ncbi:hypothetical protein RirG_026270 [Rhizophagus irregularis DAOM 197198w]|uniref:Uncharacterized protein n=1 Tax=Rhizophagus irregularis (strain DAOM 197198w) TaxID=1432141 RepID=A0A015KCB1_RHIIW|nr:hypothetical protein RirG_026270 [Rhizophagus irregularis DAOM 197198w]